MPLVMRSEKKNLKLEMKIEPGELPLMRKIVEVWLNGLKADDFSVLAAKLCVHEAVNNSVIHAYQGTRSPKRIEVDIQVISGMIRIRVKDFGKNRWIDRVTSDQGSDLEIMLSEKAHGRGLLIMKKLANDLTITNVRNKGSLIQMAVPMRYPPFA